MNRKPRNHVFSAWAQFFSLLFTGIALYISFSDVQKIFILSPELLLLFLYVALGSAAYQFEMKAKKIKDLQQRIAKYEPDSNIYPVDYRAEKVRWICFSVLTSGVLILTMVNYIIINIKN